MKIISLMKKAVFAAAIAAIGWASLVPQETRPQTGFWDGWEHLAAYFVLGIAGLIAYPAARNRMIVIAAIILYGISLEIAQGILPGRMPGIVDAIANSIGAGLAFFAIRSFERYRDRP